MPNIAGVYDSRGDSGRIESLLARMARVLDVPGLLYSATRMVGRHAGCVRLSHPATMGESSVAADERAHQWLIFDGELYNAPELRRSLRQQGNPEPALGDAALCLALYQAQGTSFIERLNGQFNVVIYHQVDDHLLVANDRYGYRPLFVAESGSRLLFAVEMKAIIAALDKTPEIDGIGLLQLFREGISLGDRTWLAPIRVLDPGTVLTVTPNGIQRMRYFKLRYREGRAPMSQPAFVEGFGIKLHQATERLMRRGGRIGISLSGGLDSRSVALSIHPSYLPVPAYTFGYPESRDVVYATMLAELLGLHHFHLALEPGYLSRVLAPVVWRTEGQLPFTSTTSLFFHRRIGAEMDVILNGHCGDALTGSHIRPFMMMTRSRSKLIERLFKGRALVRNEDLRRLFQPAFYHRYAAGLFDATVETFRDIDCEDVPNVADAWDMENRQRRGTFQSPSVDRYRFEARTPFLDNELVDHLLQAPPRWRFQQEAYKKMILFAFPHAAHVPWAYTGHPLTASAALELARISWNYGARRIRPLFSRLTGRVAHGDDFRDLTSELREDRRIARGILDFAASPLFPDHVFDRRGVEDAVARHWDGRQDLTHPIAVMATVAMAHRLFLRSDLGAIPPEAEPTLTELPATSDFSAAERSAVEGASRA